MRAKATAPNGFALIAVLWFLVMIAAIGTYLLANARAETALARNIRSAAAAEALADAGIAEAVFNQTDPIPAARWALNGEPHLVRLNGGEMTIRLYDENAKINPNIASGAMMSGLFQALGVDRNRARRLAAAIAEWVGSEKTGRLQGPKLEQYRAAGKTYGPPNAAMETLDELPMVLGMTPELAALIRPYVTIYSESQAPDAAKAGPVIRRALALAAREGSAAEAGPVQAAPAGSSDPDVVQQTGNAAGTATPANPAQPKAETPVFMLHVIARAADGGIFVRDAVVRINPSTTKGYAVLAWRRGELPE